MPEKEGAEEKTTKDVVNKKQKQMMNKEEYTTEMVRKIKKKINPKAVFPTVAQNKVRGEIIKGDDLSIDNKNPVKKQKKNLDEEGYDIARDMGRVRPSKDKKDATSYPPSDEVKKTQKKNKGPSALERVKADIMKRGEKIMDVKKEELDLTQVAESLGGHIVEVRRITKTTDRPYFRKRNVRKFSTDQQDESDFEQRVLDDFLRQQNNQTNRRGRVTQNLSYPSDGRRTTGHDTEDFLEPDEKEKTKTKTKTVTNRRLQIVKDAGKKATQTATKTAKYLKKHPFATLVGASMAKDTFFPAKLPTPPTVQGGKVGRRTAG